MRILVLVDHLKGSKPQLQADLDLLTKHLDPGRIQLLVAALRGKQDGVIDVGLEASGWFGPRACYRLYRMVRDLGIEAIHALEPSAVFCAAVAGRLAGIPVLVTCSNIELLHDQPMQRLQQRLIWRLTVMLAADRVVVPSEIVKNRLLALVKTQSERIAVIYRALPTKDGALPNREQLGLPDGPLVTMSVPPDADAGYDMALDSLHRLMKRQPQVHLAVLGSGPTVVDLQRKAANIRPALPIRWLGDSLEPYAVISASDVVIDCASREWLPPSLIWAALAAKPIVAARLGGITEIVEANVSGLLITPGDSSDMAVQISRLLQFDGLAHRLGRMAQRRGLERFSMDAQRQAMTELYESTVYATR